VLADPIRYRQFALVLESTSREGYRWRDFNVRDLWSMAAFPGFWRMLSKHGASGLTEVRNSLWKEGYLELCRRYCPELELDDLEPHPSGVHAQAVMADGTMAHDFLIRSSRRSLHVCYAPSPAATSALPIGAYLVEQFDRQFEASPSISSIDMTGATQVLPNLHDPKWAAIKVWVPTKVVLA
jgi:(S)-2-hydroxyglutarate dehydrogenase